MNALVVRERPAIGLPSLSFVTRHTHMCDMSHSYVCDMTHSYVCDMTDWHILRAVGVTCLWYVKGPIHTCDMTHSYVWHDSFVYVTWLIRMCVTWLIHIFCAPSASCDSFTYSEGIILLLYNIVIHEYVWSNHNDANVYVVYIMYIIE